MNKLAQFGTIDPPPGVEKYGGELSGLAKFFSVLLNTMIMIAGIYALINFVIAGYDFISAGGDSDKIGKATQRIWQSIVGLVLVGGALTLAAIVGQLFFGDPGAIIDLKIFVP